MQFKKLKNTDSNIVHGVNPKTDFTFCGLPEGIVVDVAFMEEYWDNWKYSDKEVTCKSCLRSIT